MRTHPITGLMLEDGSGALPDEEQARRIHIPFIRRTQGDAAADAMLAKLDDADEPVEEAAPAQSPSPDEL